MTQIPSQHQVQQLAADVARDGLDQHEARVNDLLVYTEKADSFPGAIEVLREQACAPIMRVRAFATIVANWPEIRYRLEHGTDFESRFDALVAQWHSHEDLRATGSIAALWESRATLDNLRGRSRELIQRW